MDWIRRAEALQPEMIARRRDLHQHPELSFQEFRTAGMVAQELGALGLEVQSGVGKTGVVGILEGAHDGPTIMLRCDMDALPVVEANHTEYNSLESGKMHACGHDGHTTIGLAVAKLLTAERDHLHGRVKFVFQPAEEIGQGAAAMLADGVLSDPKPDYMVGLHLWNEIPVGEVNITDGAMMAGSADWDCVVHGKGGHAALPHRVIDPVVAAAHIVTALQTVVSRSLEPTDTAVVSTTIFNAAQAHNVIPSAVTIGGTFRYFSPDTGHMVEQRIREICTSVAAAFGCTAEVTTIEHTPPVINNAEVNARLRTTFTELDSTTPLHYTDGFRTMVAEDVAEFLNRIPGTFLLVGSANAERGLNYPHHHPQFDFDEAAMPIGVGLLSAAIGSYLIPE